ncbi:MAG: hypothetical protein K1X50_14305, partial [Candidatus Promineofilum sp.]|nr:hypothetical protein [Promineifilum sp.]
INCGQEASFDRVAASLSAEPGGEAVLLLADGYARRLPVAAVEAAPKANTRGKALVARRSAVVGLAPAGPLTLITDRRLLAVDGAALPLEEGTRAQRLAKLAADEAVVALATGRD